MLENRLLYELHLLNDFKKTHDYLPVFCIVSDDPLSIAFSISVKGNEYIFNAVFNKYFPKQPIVIKKITKFKTSHCYKDGTMCLKWGQDNWDENTHLTQLIENLYQLLFDENPLGDEHGFAENGDEFTFGQNIRMSDSDLLIIPYNILNICGHSGAIECIETTNEDRKIYIITKIDDKEIFNPLGKDVFKMNYLNIDFQLKDVKSFKIDELRNSLQLDISKNHILFSSDNRAFILLKDEDSIREIDYVVSHDEVFKRSDISKDILNKKISIIGLGSVGSRVLCDLARAGFSNFFIVDDDFFLPFNVLRHELTYRHVGSFKVDALKEYIVREINQKATITISRLAPTGQESSSSTNRLLKSLEDSSIIIDCTGCDAVYYTVDALLAKNAIPFISGTVIPGGLGNIIIYRSRESNLDLESILKSYWRWENCHSIFAENNNDYSANINEQTHIATMSDCSILSGMIGRFSIDILLNKQVKLDNINVFSTSDYKDLTCYYKTFSITASSHQKQRCSFSETDLKDGRKIYEDYCSKNSNK